VNPTVMEVLSPSTESFDRGEKFQRYRTWNKSLRHCVLIAQSKPFVECFRRQADESWNLSESLGLESKLHLPSIGCARSLADVYDRIVLSEALPESGG
ncbi:MAG TPA: Uma2 family endonuclease, partial [Gemmataceae bacterium]|nr:Uma2 family endonuclease [Gemmataceae bacterium]